MSLPKNITIRIKNGTAIIDAEGFHGQGCSETIDKIIEQLVAGGIKVKTIRDDKKPEYYEDGHVDQGVYTG